MKYQDLKTKKIPQAPGVYFFICAGGKILYIGKATSLRDRVRSYFVADVINTRGPQIVSMVEKSKAVKIKPTYNTKEKDDRSFNHIIITDEVFPRVLIVRGREIQNKLKTTNYKLKTIFGPFPRGGV